MSNVVDRLLDWADRAAALPASERRKLGEELLAEADSLTNGDEKSARRMRVLAQGLIDSAKRESS